MNTKPSLIKWISAGLLVVVVAAVAGYLWLQRQANKPPAPVPTTTVTAVPSTVPAPPQHPISAAQVAPAEAATTPLPALEDSDGLVRDEMSKLGGDMQHLLVGSSLIPRIVSTVNALPGDRLPSNVLPVRSPGGTFLVKQVDDSLVMAPENARRYARYTTLLEQVDTQQAVSWYVHSYPLFEQAWRQLGYPKSQFNDRLVQVLDLLLKTPVPARSPKLVGTAGLYHFVDPQLENLAIGQKVLLRLGPQKERAALAKLRAIRAALTGQHPAVSSSS